MRRTLFPPYSNPIARREISAYERGMPLWMRRCDTVGIVAVALATCLYLIVRWLPHVGTGFSESNLIGRVQVTVFTLYGCVLVRCLIAGISVSHPYQKRYRNAIVLTNLTHRHILFGQWYAALYQVRGWMMALGLLRMAIMVILTAEYKFWVHSNAFDFAQHPTQLPVAFSFIIVLGLLEVWATTGVGILAATWVRPLWFAGIIAIVLRILPIVIFTWFPIISGSGSFDWLVLRWEEYTWFAFVDGGTSAILRLTLLIPYVNLEGYFFARSTLAFLAASHMLLVYGTGAFIFSSLRWRQLGTSSEQENYKPAFSFIAISRLHFENSRIITVALGTCVMMFLAWRDGIHLHPIRGSDFYYNPGFLQWLQVVLWVAIIVTTLRMIHAGIIRGRQFSRYSLETKNTSIIAAAFTHQGLNVFSKLRGWFFALGILLISAFALLIEEHMMNMSAAHIFTCNSSRMWLAQCFTPNEMWSLSQWVFGLAFAIILSFIIPFSSICIGMASGIVFRRPLVAFIAAVGIRAIPVLINMTTPDIQPLDRFLGLLITRWHHDTWMIFADTGISALVGIAEPGWHSNTQYGLMHIGFGLLAFTLVVYMLLGYIALSLIAVKVKYRRIRTITAQLASDVHH